MKNVTFHFVVIANFERYVGTKFNENHDIKTGVNSTYWAKLNIPKYFNGDFKLIDYTIH
jgi:hypothetical protein